MDGKNLQQNRKKTEEIKTDINLQENMQEQSLERQSSIWAGYQTSSKETEEKEKKLIDTQNNKDVWKYEKKCKKAQKAWDIARESDEKRKEEFFGPVNDMMNKVKDQLDMLKNGNQNQLVQVLASMENCMKSNDKGFQVNQVIMDEQEKTPQFNELSELFSQLQRESAFSISREKTKELLEKYQGLNLKVEATCSKYLKTEKHGDREFSGDEILNPEVCYYLLYNSVAVALRDHVDKMDPQKVDMKAFSKLCGIALSSTLAANAICNHQEFASKKEDRMNEIIREEKERLEEEKHKEEERIEEEKRKKEEWLAKRKLLGEEKLAELKKDNLETLKEQLSSYKPMSEWFKPMLEEYLETYYSEIFYHESTDFMLAANKIIKNINQRIGDIEQNLEQLSDIHQDMPKLKEYLYKKIVKEQGDALGKNVSISLEQTCLEELHKDKMVLLCANRRKELEEKIPELKGNDAIWKDEDLQEIILESENNEAFAVIVNNIQEQIKVSMKRVEYVINRKVLPINQEFAKKCAMEYLGLNGLLSAPNIVERSTNMFLSNKNIFATNLFVREKNIRKAMVKLGLGNHEAEVSRFLESRQIKDYSSNSVLEMLMPLQERLTENRKYFDEQTEKRRLHHTHWQEIYHWCEQNVIMDSNDFKAKLSAKLSKYHDSKTAGMDKDTYLYGKKGEQITVPKEGYLEKIKGKYLCQGDCFGGLMQNKEDMVLNALEEIIQGKYLNEELPFLNNVQNLDSIENLTLKEFDELMTTLRVNISTHFEQWMNIKHVNAEGIQRKLLPAMMRGKLSQEEFIQKVNEENEAQKKEFDFNKIKLYVSLNSSLAESDEVQYQLINAKEEDKQLLAEKRIEKFSMAKQAWSMLESSGEVKQRLLEVFSQFLNDFKQEWDKKNDGKASFEEEYVKSLEEFAGYLSGTNKKTKYAGDIQYYLGKDVAERIKQNLGEIYSTTGKKVKLKEYIKEFMLCGTEKNLLGFGSRGETLLTAGSEKEYNRFIYDMSHEIVYRNMKILNFLKSEHVDDDKINTVLNKLKPMIAEMETPDSDTMSAKQIEDIKRANKEKFGASQFEDIYKYIVVDDILGIRKGESKEGAEWSKWDYAVKLYDERVLMLTNETTKTKENKNGTELRPIVPFLLKDNKTMEKILTLDDQGFQDYVEKLKAGNVGKILEGMRSQSIYAVKQQFISEHLDYIMNDKNTVLKESDWSDKFNKYTNNLFRKKINGKTILERINKYTSDGNDVENAKKFGALYIILKNNPDAFKMLLTDKEFKSTLNRYMKNEKQNLEYLQSLPEYKKLRKIDKTNEFATKYKREQILLMSTDEFKGAVAGWIKEYTDKMNQVTIQKDSSRLDENAKHVSELERRKLEGDKKKKELIGKKLDELRTQIWHAASPYQVLEEKEKELTKKEVDKYRKKIEKEFKDFPKIVVDCILENKMRDTDLDYDELKDKAIILENIYKKLEADKEIPEENAKKFLIYLDLWAGKRLVAFTGDYLQLKYQYLDFHAKQQRIDALKAKADVPELSVEVRDFMECMNRMGLYTMKQKMFDEFMTKGEKYFDSMVTALNIFANEISYYDLNEKERSNLNRSLLHYFSKQIVEGKEDIQDEVRKLLSDEAMRKFLCKPEKLIGSVDADSLKKQENFFTHKDIMKLIQDSNDKALIGQYNDLNEEERQIFALTLMIPGRLSENDLLPSVSYLHGEETETEEEQQENVQIQDLIRSYIKHDKFQPTINYTQVYEKLRNGSTGLNKDVFKQTMEFTMLCRMQYIDNTAKDWERIGNGTSSIEAAKLKNGKGAEAYANLHEIQNLDSFTEDLKKLVDKDEKADENIKKRLQKLLEDKYNLPVLIMALQNRTMLDRTTGVNVLDRANGIVHNFVDEELRDSVRNIWINADEKKQETLFINAGKTKFCTQAFTSLLSYQLRDDISFLNRSITKKDFASGALERETVLDWKLIKHALDFVDEVDTERLRREAVQMAPKVIERSGNVKAISQYKDYKEVFGKLNENKGTKQEYRDKFEDFLKKNLNMDCLEKDLNDNEQKNPDYYPESAMLMAGYQDLDDNQKALFIQVLQRRDFLDVSKIGSVLNHFGLAEREYVNSQGRDELIDQYIRKTLTRKGRVTASSKDYENAVYSLLSTQVDDDVDFSKKKEKKIEDFFTRERLLRHNRKTAIDWKLFKRALQFVQRATNERDIFIQNQELYLSQAEEGADTLYMVESAFLRKNLHKSGNRVSRFIGKRVLSHFVDKFPVKLQRMALLVLSTKTANEINKIDAFQKDEKIGELFGEALSKVNKSINTFVSDMSEGYVKIGLSTIYEMYENQSEDMLAVYKIKEENRVREKKDGQQDIFDIEEKVQSDKKKLEEQREQRREKIEQAKKDTMKKLVQVGKEEKEKKEETKEKEGKEETKEKKKEGGEEKEEKEEKEPVLADFVKNGKITRLDVTEYKLKQLRYDVAKIVKKNNNAQKTLKNANARLKQVNKYIDMAQAFQKQGGLQPYIGQIQDCNYIPEEYKKKICSAAESVHKEIVGEIKEIVGETGDKISGHMDTFKEYSKKFQEYSSNMQEIMGTVSKISGYVMDAIKTGISVVEVAQKKASLTEAQKEALEKEDKDKERTEKAKRKQNAEEQENASLAIKQNKKYMAITKEVTDANLNDEIAKTVLEYTTDLIGTFANTETVGFDVKAIMTEVTEIIFFFRNLYKDNEMLKLYFDENQKDVKRLKEKFGELKANVNSDILDKYSNMRLIQEAKGFESFTELAEYVGRNMVQSLLFCASKFNTQLGTRIQSVAVLKVLGEENSIGAMDSATAERVFGKLFNQNYR